MILPVQQKISEYKNRFIQQSGYVVEIGSYDLESGARHLFEDADDFCGIDTHRGPGVDIVSPMCEIGKLFEFNPDTIIFIKKEDPDRQTNMIIRQMRNMLINGGFMVTALPSVVYRPYIDLLFGGYEVMDLTEVESTICGIARKPYKIRHDSKTNS